MLTREFCRPGRSPCPGPPETWSRNHWTSPSLGIRTLFSYNRLKLVRDWVPWRPNLVEVFSNRRSFVDCSTKACRDVCWPRTKTRCKCRQIPISVSEILFSNIFWRSLASTKLRVKMIAGHDFPQIQLRLEAAWAKYLDLKTQLSIFRWVEQESLTKEFSN